MRRCGFTLIELIVVLATVLILAAFIFSIFEQRVRPGRDRLSCQQNLRRIGLAIKQYMADSDSYFPSVHGNKKSYGWADSLIPYLKDTQLFQCPAEKTRPAGGDGPRSHNYTDYFYNSLLAGQNSRAMELTGNTILLGDSVPGDARQHSDGHSSKDTKGFGTTARLVNSVGVPVGAAMRHMDGANYAFADGHVKWFKGVDANTCPALKDLIGCGGAEGAFYGGW